MKITRTKRISFIPWYASVIYEWWLALLQKMKKKTLYLLSDKIKWETFKLLQDKLVKDSGPKPVHGDKVLWRMLRDKQILCWFAEDMPGDMGIGLEIPKRYKNWEISIMSSRK